MPLDINTIAIITLGIWNLAISLYCIFIHVSVYDNAETIDELMRERIEKSNTEPGRDEKACGH